MEGALRHVMTIKNAEKDLRHGSVIRSMQMKI